jgi:malate permease and related proteins
LTLLAQIFLNNILPIFLTAGAGFVVARRFKPDLKTVSRLSFYIFSPCLVFTSLTHIELSADEFWRLALFTLAVLVVMILLALTVGLAMKLERHLLTSLIIASVFVNGGNYGLALNKFAFGEAALARAVVYYIFSTLAVYTAGVAIASLGKRSAGQALSQVLTVPAVYGLLAAGGLHLTGWQLPLLLDRAISLLSEAALPVMLVLLGLQMAEAHEWPRARLVLIGVASFLQLVIAPLVGLALAYLLGLTGVTRQAAVIEASMPTAVITTILAVEYDLDPAFMTGTVILSTVLSPLTLTPLIAYLQR